VSGGVTLTGVDDFDLESPEPVVVSIESVIGTSIGTPGHVTAPTISDDPQVVNAGGAGCRYNGLGAEQSADIRAAVRVVVRRCARVAPR